MVAERMSHDRMFWSAYRDSDRGSPFPLQLESTPQSLHSSSRCDCLIAAMPEASSQSEPACSTQTAETERYLAAAGFVSIEKYRADFEDIKLKGSKDNRSFEENRALRNLLKAWDKQIVLSKLGPDKVGRTFYVLVSDADCVGSGHKQRGSIDEEGSP